MKYAALAAVTSVSLLAACETLETAEAPATATIDRSAPAVSASIAKNAEISYKGLFGGKSDHKTFGTATIGKSGERWVVILGEDFRFDGAPDPHVALGKDGYNPDAELATLSSYKGRQVYALPADLDPAEFNEVWLWCNQFNVPLGVAQLKEL